MTSEQREAEEREIIDWLAGKDVPARPRFAGAGLPLSPAGPRFTLEMAEALREGTVFIFGTDQ